MSLDNLTIVIPTLNRHDRLTRLLEFYERKRFSGNLIILDSSNCLLDVSAYKLKINYINDITMSDYAALQYMSKIVTTKYVTYCGDDDVQDLEGLCKSINFLDDHSDFVACCGRGIFIETKNDELYSSVTKQGLYRFSNALEVNNLERLKSFLSDYWVPLYCVVRSDVWKNAWQYSSKLRDRFFSAELLPCILIILSGKIFQHDIITTVRFIHNKRYEMDDEMAWIINCKERDILSVVEKIIYNDKDIHNFKKLFIKYYLNRNIGNRVIRVLCDYDLIILAKIIRVLVLSYRNIIQKLRRLARTNSLNIVNLSQLGL